MERKRLQHHLGVLAFLCCLLFLLFHKIFFTKGVLYGWDTLGELYYWYSWSFEQLREGDLPLWNPFFLSGYPFFASDPMAMTKVIRQVAKPCLGFKILAAGRMCDKANKVEAAFKFAFEHIMPTDGVIVGMYPRYHDQISQNAEYTRKFAST